MFDVKRGTFRSNTSYSSWSRAGRPTAVSLWATFVETPTKN